MYCQKQSLDDRLVYVKDYDSLANCPLLNDFKNIYKALGLTIINAALKMLKYGQHNIYFCFRKTNLPFQNQDENFTNDSTF